MRKMKIGDLFIILGALTLILIFSGRYFHPQASQLFLKVTGRYSQNLYPLDEDAVFEVEGPLGTTRIVVRGGEAWIEDSPCREKICMKMGKVKRVGEQAVCVPNGVVIECTGGGGYIDGVSR